MGWTRHADLEDTAAFLAFAQSDWRRWPVGPLLIESRADGRLLGSTGLAFETDYRASTGYVLARDAWGNGFAQEALAAVTALAAEVGLRRLYALCHRDHVASARVLERCGFDCEGILRRHLLFPNLGDMHPQDVYCYSRSW